MKNFARDTRMNFTRCSLNTLPSTVPHRDKRNPGLSAEIDKLYSRYYCKYYGKDIKASREYSEEQAIQRAQIAEKYGFSDIRHVLGRHSDSGIYISHGFALRYA